MTTRDDILEILRKQEPVLRSRFKVRSIGLFGSFVRNEPRTRSDIDLLVDFDEIVGLFHFVRLEQYLADLLGRRVDLVMKDGLKPGIGRRILEEAVYP